MLQTYTLLGELIAKYGNIENCPELPVVVPIMYSPRYSPKSTSRKIIIHCINPENKRRFKVVIRPTFNIMGFEITFESFRMVMSEMAYRGLQITIAKALVQLHADINNRVSNWNVHNPMVKTFFFNI